MVRPQGTQFVLDRCPFSALGFNAYYLPYCSGGTQRKVLEAAHAARANTCRTWAFEHLEQTAGLGGLDRLIALAEETGIYLILPLMNYWPDFGGMTQYAPADDFFRSATAMAAYDRWAERLLTRRNAATGRLYLDEPAVLAWELANEPRMNPQDPPDALVEWARQASAAIKRIDSDHMLAVGDEGFFTRRRRFANRFGSTAHLYDGRYGVDARALLALPAIDFGTYHLYPDNWRVPARFGKRWIREHIRLGQELGKPVVLEEFGLPESYPQRDDLYSSWVHEASQAGAGALVWMVGCSESDSARYCDRYTLPYFFSASS